jgi:hypothetical protein
MAWPQQGFRPTPIEEIRASTLDFKQFILRCLDRMDMALPNCLAQSSYLLIRAKLDLLNSAAYFYVYDDPEFLKKVEGIIAKAKVTPVNSYEYYSLLMEWLQEISRRYFQKMEVIPPVPGTIWMGREHYERPQQKEAAPHSE